MIIATAALTATAASAANKPNFLMIWGDDIGYWNISAYNMGMMGYKTPNIDRLVREGVSEGYLFQSDACQASVL